MSDFAELGEFAAEVLRRHHHDGNDLDEIVVRVGEQPQVDVHFDDFTEVLDERREPFADAVVLLPFRVHEGDRLAIFADADQPVAEIGFFLSCRKFKPTSRLPIRMVMNEPNAA